MIIVSRSENQTVDIGAITGKFTGKGDIILLEGELGSGKTTLVSGILKGMGIEDYKASSPSFTFHNIYMKGPLKVVHYDLYREEGDYATIDDFREYLEDSVLIIEWAQKIKFKLKYAFIIKIEYLTLHSRIIKIDLAKKELLKPLSKQLKTELLSELQRYIYEGV